MTDATMLAGAKYRAPAAGDWPAAELEFLDKCPICGSEQRVVAYEGLQDKVFFCAPGVWTMWRCGGCNMGYLDPRPTRGSIGRAYASYYTHADSGAAETAKPVGFFKRLRRIVPNAYLNKYLGYRLRPALPLAWLALAMRPRRARGTMHFYRHLPAPRAPGDRVLDIGCGGGHFLRSARADLGYEVEGLEIDPAARAVAQGLGLTVHAGGLPGSGLTPGTYYQITLSHVVEHLHDPVAAMREVLDLLKPGGRVWIAVPNMAADSLRRFGAHSRLLEPPRHLVMFDPDSLRALLEGAGFVGIELLAEPHAHEFVIDQSRMIELGIDPYAPGHAVAGTDGRGSPRAAMGRADPHAEIITMIAFKPDR